MKKELSPWEAYIIIFGILLVLSAASFLFNSTTGLFSVKERYLIRPYNAAAASELKTKVNVLHEFRDASFSALLSEEEIEESNKYGKVERVALYQIPEPRYETSVKRAGQRACLPSSQKPWGVVKVNGGSGGNGIKVAVLDTGIAKHPDLTPFVCVDTTKKGVKSGCNDQNGHGTAVAGVIAANGGIDGKGIVGVAPNSELWVIKVCGYDGSCWEDDIAEGIYYATDNGANIISMSFGSDGDSILIRNAIEYAASRGVLLVGAAGNDGPEDGSIDWPAANNHVIAVSAIDSNDAVLSWSSRGINYRTNAWIVEEQDMELAAPGVGIETTWKDGCYRVLSGTSMAAPHVTGLAAKLWQGSAAATREYLQYLARYYYADIGRPGDDPDAGFGLPVAQ
jgi:subtilisin